jgi:uncharacterized protein YbjQ (UPF0145 family)
MDALLFTLILTISVPIIAGVVGLILQHLHYASITAREAETRGILTLSFDPEDWEASASAFVSGSTVVSPDVWRRFFAGLKSLVGGRLRSYEPVLDRGRREAFLRMKEAAIAAGHDVILNVRLETSRIAGARANGKGTTGIELVAYGTAITRAAT